jgi:DNA polymerase III subunit alpha
MSKKVGAVGYGQSRNAAGHSAFGHDAGTHDHKTPTGVRRTTNGNLKPMRWVSLHHHTTLSYGDGFGLPIAHARRAEELLLSGICFTEHGNISSHVKAEAACEKVGIKPMFGCEMYMTNSIAEGQNTQKKYHLTVIAKDQEGYKNLMQLVSASFAEGFHYEPTIDYELLKKYRRGLIVLSGCQGSLLFCSAVGGKLIPEEEASYARARKVARWFKRTFGDDYFIEVQAFPELDKTRRFAPIAEQLSDDLGIGLVGTMDIHYTAPEEAEIQKVLHNLRAGEKRTLEELERDWGYDVPLCAPPSDKSIFGRLRATGLSRKKALEAIVNTELIAQSINVKLPKLPMLRYPLPRGYETAEALVMDWLRDGWKFRGLNRMSRSEQDRYKAVMFKELNVIKEKDFFDYFLVVSDSVKFAKDGGIPVGPARGSAAASLVCWLLRITEVNPVLFPNLVFERFIDVSRSDLPDIDLDFPAWGRPLVRDYLVAKYGEESVGNIGTFTNYKAKLALDDVAKVHRIPQHEVNVVKELLVERSSGDLRASATIADTAAHFEEAAAVFKKYPALNKAKELEGNIKTFGVHAAGLVVANGDIRDVCALYAREMPKGSGNWINAVSMDKYDAERQGLLKLDYLALSTLDMITAALGHIGMSLQDLYKIPLEHPEILKGFQENDCDGIFQFDGRAARSVNQSLRPDTFVEICDVIALCRPGPLHSGAAGDYIATKHGRRARESIHPALDSITDATHGQIVYQEQILRVVTEIGAFGWTHASEIRRIMSKKEGSAKFNAQWRGFLEGALSWHKRNRGPKVTKDAAEYMWNRCMTAGAYAFNFAHCVSYGMLGAWAMWIKRLHAPVFFASALAHLPVGTKLPSQHEKLMRNAGDKGIKLLPPSPKHLVPTWAPVPLKTKMDGTKRWKKAIRSGLVQVDNIGEAKAEAILEYASDHKVETWSQLQAVKGIGEATIEKIEQFCASDDPFKILRLDRTIARLAAECNDAGLPEPSHKGSDVPWAEGQDEECIYMGIVVKRNLKDIFESHRAKTGEELDPKDVKDPHLREQVVLTCWDGTEVVTVRFNRWRYPRWKKPIWGLAMKHDVILVHGVKPGWRAAREIYANKMWVIDPDE